MEAPSPLESPGSRRMSLKGVRKPLRRHAHATIAAASWKRPRSTGEPWRPRRHPLPASSAYISSICRPTEWPSSVVRIILP